MAVTESGIREALREVIDPELGINIVDLGLVYGIEVEDARVRVVMTMTTPACPLSGYIEGLVRSAVAPLVAPPNQGRDRGAESSPPRIEVSLVWDPPWSPEMMSPDAKRQLDGGL